jgi:hypothetical protein
MILHCGISGLLNEELVNSAVQKYVPVKFDWWLFLSGMLLIYAGLYQMLLLSGVLRKNSKR